MAANGYDLANEPGATREDPVTLSHLFRRGGWQLMDDELRAGKMFFIVRHTGRARAVLMPIETYDAMAAALTATPLPPRHEPAE